MMFLKPSAEHRLARALIISTRPLIHEPQSPPMVASHDQYPTLLRSAEIACLSQVFGSWHTLQQKCI